jgi:hypothetical protein
MVRNSIPLRIKDVAAHLSLLTSEVLNEVSFRELVVTRISAPIIEKTLDAIRQDASA